MGKSLGNYIALEDPPKDMYGKLMSIPDSIVPLYYELLTDLSEEDLKRIREAFKTKSSNLMNLKKNLALLLTSEFHGPEEGVKASEEFVTVVQKGGEPQGILEVTVSANTPGVVKFGTTSLIIDLPKIATDAGIINSRSEGIRLIKQGAISVNGKRVENSVIDISKDSKIRIGRLRWIRIVSAP